MLNKIKEHKDEILGIFAIVAWLSACGVFGWAIGMTCNALFGKIVSKAIPED